MKMNRYFTIAVVVLVMVALVLGGCSQPAKPAPSAPAATPATSKAALEDFYKKNTLNLLVAADAGAASDIYARALAPHLSAVLGNPVVVKNETEAAGMGIANNTYNGNVKPDGLYLLVVPSGALWANYSYNAPGVAYKIDTFEYIGADRSGGITFTVSSQPPYNSIKGLQESTKTLKFVAMGVQSKPTVCSIIVCEVFGLKADIVAGYKGTADRLLAIEQGESQGACMAVSSAQGYEKAGKVKNLFIVRDGRDPLYPDIPAINEVVKFTDYHNQLLSGIEKNACVMVAAPPGTPKDKVAFLQEKLAAAYAIPAYQDAIRKTAGVWNGVITGEQLKKEALDTTAAKPVFSALYEKLFKQYVK